MNTTWYSDEIPLDVALSLIEYSFRIPAPTAHVGFCITLALAGKTTADGGYNLSVSGLVPPDITPNGALVERSKEPHMYVKHSNIGPFVFPVFKDTDGRVFIRIHIGGGPMDVFLLDDAPRAVPPHIKHLIAISKDM